jgi:TorA maturation chaperone TorD
LLGQLQVAVTEAPDAGGFLEEPWRDLVASARSLNHDQVVTEYNRLFGGVGKPEVYLYGSHYLSGFLNEKPLVKLRDDLAALGLGKGEGMSDTEDHVAYVFEVMRYLIAGDDVAVANLTHQMAFFSQHLQPWVPQMCQTLRAHPAAVFYAHLAAFTEAFLSVETQGFDLVA